MFRQDTTPSTHGKYEAAKYALPLLPRVFAPARCSIEHQPVYKIPIIKILVGVFARARAMEKYEERSPRTFYRLWRAARAEDFTSGFCVAIVKN